MTTRDQIIKGAARAFWVCAYADHIEEGNCVAFFEACADCTEKYEEGLLSESEHVACHHDCPFGQHDKPGAGEDWMDYAPPTGPSAYEKARQLVQRIESLNILSCEEEALGFWFGKNYPDADPDLFGHYLAMEALGHGVSWADSHEDHGLKVPYMEFWV